MNNTKKTILLIGRTGDGKSALANILANTGKFKESQFAVSQTKKIEEVEFEEDNITYRIVDTVGIGDTKMTIDKVLRKLALMGYSVKDDLSQILFVTNGRLVEESKSTYNLLEKVIFDEHIAEYTTIIRTNFPGFMDSDRCRKDRQKMIENNQELEELIQECKDIIYVDNPPIDIVDNEDLVASNSERRENSRRVLIKHLKSVCQGDYYKPNNLKVLSDAISSYMEKKEKLKEELNKIEEKGWKGKMEGEWKKAKNSLLNTKITNKMLEHIGNLSPKFKGNIERWLEQLEEQTKGNKEKKSFKWLFDEDLQAQEQLGSINTSKKN